MWQLIAMAVISAIGAFAQSESQRRQNNYEAAVNRQNAIAKRHEAELTKKKFELDVRLKTRDQRELRRQYLEAAGTNQSMLAAGNVDLTSGSALDLLEGNYNRYADDMGEMEFDKVLTTWQGNRTAQVQNWEADVMDNRASYLEQTAGSLGESLLAAGVAGFTTYYGMKGFGAGGGSSGTITKAGGRGGAGFGPGL